MCGTTAVRRVELALRNGSVAVTLPLLSSTAVDVAVISRSDDRVDLPTAKVKLLSQSHLIRRRTAPRVTVPQSTAPYGVAAGATRRR